jgi:hypothetical protein
MSKIKIVALALTGHALVVAPSTVLAQIEAPREAAQIQLGPVALYPSLQIIDAGRDQNVFNDETNPKEDLTLTAASRALAVARFGQNELLFSAGNDYVWFRQYAQERSSNTRYSLRFNLSASRFKPFVGVDRQHTRSRLNAEIDTRARRLESSAVAGFNFNVAERTALTASINVNQATFDPGEQFRGVELGDALNRSERSATAGVRYALTPLTSVAVVGNFTEDRFPDSHLRDSRSYSVAPTFEFSPDAAIRGKLSIGVEKFQPLEPTLPAYLGPIYEASLNWSLFGRTTFDVSGTQDTRYSYQDSTPYYLLTGARLNIAQRLFGPVDLLGGADWQHLLYRWHHGLSAEEIGVNRTETMKVVSGGVGVNLGHGFRVTLRGERTERRSPQNPRQNYQRNRLLSSVTIGS